MGAMPSPITGSAGNIEFLLHARTPDAGPRPCGPDLPATDSRPPSSTAMLDAWSPRPMTKRRQDREPWPSSPSTPTPTAPRPPPWPSGPPSWLTEQGHRSIVGPRAGRLGLGRGGRPAGQPGRGRHPAAGGGDGSGRGIPVLGVNIGRLGYLTQIEPAGLEEALAAFLAGTHQVEERMTLSVTVRGPDGEVVAQRTALNEATVEKTVPGHTVRIAASIDDRPFVTYAADGLLVATPTGSTAYNLSARGPVLSPRLRAIVVTPVSPHMLFDRPLVLEPTEQTPTRRARAPLGRAGGGRGHGRDRSTPGSTVECREGDQPARLVTFGSTDFHSILRAKFHLADR